MAKTSNQIQVNKEAVRLLVLQEGVREAARLAGLNENTVLSWAHRYDWKVAIKSQSHGHSALVDTVQSELEQNERATRISLSRYSKRAAQEAEEAKLKDAGNVHKAAQVAGITFKWDQKLDSTANVIVNVALLGIPEYQSSGLFKQTRYRASSCVSPLHE